MATKKSPLVHFAGTGSFIKLAGVNVEIRYASRGIAFCDGHSPVESPPDAKVTCRRCLSALAKWTAYNATAASLGVTAKSLGLVAAPKEKP